MATVKFIRSDGKEFYIDNSMWKITKLENFGSVNNSITNEDNATSDGSDFVSEKINEIDRTVEFVLIERKLNNSMRDIARNFFVPKYQFECHINYNGIKKWCKGRLYKPYIPTDNINAFLKLSITLLCNDPFFYSEDSFSKDIAGVNDMLEFPLEITDDGVEFDSFEFSNEVSFINDGDVETNCVATMKFSGEVVNPKLILGDYFVRVIDTMQSNDILVIDLVNRPIKIIKNNENIIRKIDRLSNFDKIKFKVGENTIGYGADSGDNNMNVNISVYRKYIGL